MKHFEDYSKTIDYLFSQLAVFQREGGSAYKPGLQTSMMLDEAFGHPHRKFKSIHVAGTNGKGSTAHTLAAVLQSAGYKTGLYTSPHLVDFRERIRVNGRMIPADKVVDFVNRYLDMGLDCKPSFFELTMMMAFEYFASEAVDVAVIEVGLGGRLDSTNIITPELCVITNISKDHTQFLGNTLPEIAAEKAGIMKPGIPVVIGEAEGDVKDVFDRVAAKTGARAIYAAEHKPIKEVVEGDGCLVYDTVNYGEIRGELTGICQKLNAATILTAIDLLNVSGWQLGRDAVARGFSDVTTLTGLMGRWWKVSDKPLVICDTGHNQGGWELLSRQLSDSRRRKFMVIGFVGDKDVDSILSIMATIPDATMLFTNASIPRAMAASDLAEKAATHGLFGETFDTVGDAYKKALAEAGEDDMIFIGGSTFVVADFLSLKD